MSSIEVKLVKALITNTKTGEVLEVMFNPSEYVLTKQAIYSEDAPAGKNTSYIHFNSGRRRQLRVELFFDTTDTGEDVSEKTRMLEKFMEVSYDDGGNPDNPVLTFKWGSLNFECVLEDLRMQFTKFSNDGTPLRVIVRALFSEYVAMGDDLDLPSESAIKAAYGDF